MQATNAFRLILVAMMAALLSACAATGVEPIEATNENGAAMIKSIEPQQSQPYRFYPGDEIAIRAVNRPELSIPSLRVDPYGFISFPYLGQVEVKNLTAQEVADRLVRALQEGDYYKRVDLGVALVGSKEQFVYVLGEVKKPGPIPINGSIRLMDALGLSGGQTYDAEMSTVMWIRGRQTPPGAVKINLKAFGDPRASGDKMLNLTLLPGDVIYVPDAPIVSVQRFFNRMFDILRPIVLLENGIILWDSVELILRGAYPRNSNNATTIIVNPLAP